MYELNHITGNSYYIQSPSKMGLVKLSDTDVCLIDSGNDKDAGRKVRQLLDANGWHLTAIYNTHSNADHIGGNRYLQGQTKCKIYAQGIECDITRHPVLEPAFLYGGFPPKDLRHKFLMAQESDAQELTPAVLPEGFELLQLPGHFFHMVGFRGPDDVVYLSVQPRDAGQVPDRLSLRCGRLSGHAGEGQDHAGCRLCPRPRPGHGGHRAPGSVQHRQGA